MIRRFVPCNSSARPTRCASDKDIDTSDIPEIEDFSGAVRGRFYRPVKQQITLRIDADLLAWFRSLGDKYQTRINAALREYMAPHRKAG